jgi:hypothetical protein
LCISIQFWGKVELILRRGLLYPFNYGGNVFEGNLPPKAYPYYSNIIFYICQDL